MYRANGALQEAAYGNSAEARQSAAEALRLAPGNPNVAVQAGLAFAMAGETARALALVQDLQKRFPLDTQIQLLGLPALDVPILDGLLARLTLIFDQATGFTVRRLQRLPVRIKTS